MSNLLLPNPKKQNRSHIPCGKWRRSFECVRFLLFWGKDSITLVRLAQNGFPKSLPKFLFRFLTFGTRDIIFLRPSHFEISGRANGIGADCAECPRFHRSKAKFGRAGTLFQSKLSFRDQHFSMRSRNFNFECLVLAERDGMKRRRALKSGFSQ